MRGYVFDGVSVLCGMQLACLFRVVSFEIRACDGEDWYAIPESWRSCEPYYRKCMRESASHYKVNRACGFREEDASYLLTLAALCDVEVDSDSCDIGCVSDIAACGGCELSHALGAFMERHGVR